jgi:Glycosyltransferase
MATFNQSQSSKIKVLLSAYACEPEKGSEPGVGWNWAKHLCVENDVTVVTRSNNRGSIEQSGEAWISSVKWIYYDLPQHVQWLKKHGFAVHLYYILWQYNACRLIKNMIARSALSIDIVHHVTFGTYWLPSWMGKLAMPFVFGPVGGGEEMPGELLKCLTPAQQRYEKRRNIAQRVFYRLFKRLTSSDNVLFIAGTDETLQKAKKHAIPCDTMVFPQAGLSEDEKACFSMLPDNSAHSSFCIMSMGRLEHWKGYHLGIQAFSKLLERHPRAEYWISSDGPERKHLEHLAKFHNCGTQVKFLGKLPTLQSLHGQLAQCNVMLHPALHETFGVACLEAMALKKPVVCINHGGPALLIGTRDVPLSPDAIETQEWSMTDCGIAINDGAQQETIDRIANALLIFASNEELCRRMGKNAQNRIQAKFMWSSLATQMQVIYRKHIGDVEKNIQMISKRQGQWIVLIGPDGVGKTSVLKALMREYGASRQVKYHHWIPLWNKPLEDDVSLGGTRIVHPVSVNGVEKARSLLRLLRNAVRAQLGYWTRIKPALKKGNIIFGDRYLFNYILDPVSVRFYANQRWIRWLIPVIPTPDIIVSLVATPEIIHARKPELNVDEIVERIVRARTLERYGLPVVEISAEPSIDIVAQNIISAVEVYTKCKK